MDRENRSKVTVEQIALADGPDRWRSLGFAVGDDLVRLGTVALELTGDEARQGILSWSLRDIASTELDGLPTSIAQANTPLPSAPEHPNGVVAIDHVVAMTPDLDRGIDKLQAAGLDLRRIRERPTPAGAPRQAFFRLGEVILELVQEPDEVVRANPLGRDGPARFWGLALLTENIEHTVSAFAGHCGEVRPAVQYGRRIATVKRSAGLSLPVALMTPAVE